MRMTVGFARSSSRYAGAPARSTTCMHVVLRAGAPAYLELDRAYPTVILMNPGSPVVSSFQSNGGVVWIVDENGKRTDPLVQQGNTPPPLPVLYAFDAVTLELLT